MEMQTVVVPLGRNGKYGTLTCDCTRFAENVQKHIWEYGLRQCLNDAIATKEDDDGAKLTNEQLVAKATKRLDTLYSGELRAVRSVEPADPVEAEAYRLAWNAIVTRVKGLVEYADTKGEKDRVMATIAMRAEQKGLVAPEREALIKSEIAANKKAGYMAAAKKIVAERGTTNTDDLGIEI
jgi:hypothetical protein